MKQEKTYTTTLAVIAMSGFLLAGCGGGGGGGTSFATTINGFTVPSAPDPVANAATLAGVDSNNNGVRDDVERVIAQNTAVGDTQSYAKALAIAKAKELVLRQPLPTSRSGFLALAKNEICTTTTLSGTLTPSLDTQGSSSLTYSVFNTSARLAVLHKMNATLGGISGDEVLPCD